MCLHFIQIILWAVIQITNQEEIVSLENMTLDKLSAIGKPSILPGPSYAVGTRTSAQILKNFINFGIRNHFTLCRS